MDVIGKVAPVMPMIDWRGAAWASSLTSVSVSRVISSKLRSRCCPGHVRAGRSVGAWPLTNFLGQRCSPALFLSSRSCHEGNVTNEAARRHRGH